MTVRVGDEGVRISVHKDNLKNGDPAVWMVEDLDTGVLWAAESWMSDGPAEGAVGSLSYGPTVWVETGTVLLLGAKPAS